MSAHFSKHREGFTLVELLVVIGIIVILFSVILVAVDPARRLSQARDAVRRQDVRNLLEAVQEYMVDNDGDTPAGFDAVDEQDTGEWQQVLGADATAGACDGLFGTVCLAASTADDCLDLSADLVETYLADIPFDPKDGDANITYYYADLSDNGRVEIGACAPEVASTIEVKR